MATSRSDSWVRRVAETSNAMDLPQGIFNREPAEIARGLQEAVMQSTRTKGTKFQSAMSMLNLFINRAGRNLSARDRARLEKAKDELRKIFGRPTQRGAHARRPQRVLTHRNITELQRSP